MRKVGHKPTWKNIKVTYYEINERNSWNIT